MSVEKSESPSASRDIAIELTEVETDSASCLAGPIEWLPVVTAGATPPERMYSSTAALGPHIYCFGGCTKVANTTRYLGDFYVYDSELRKWTELSQLQPRPQARHSATMVAHGNRLFLFGGCGEGQLPLNDLWLFDMTTQRWTKVRKTAGELLAEAKNHSARRPSRQPPTTTPPLARSNSIQVGPSFSAARASGSSTNKPKADDWPRARYLHSAVVYNDEMFVYGGWMADWSRGDRVWRLDLTTLNWNELDLAKGSPIPERRFGHIAAVWDHRMFLFGGSRSTKATNELWAFDLLAKKWTLIEANGNEPSPRQGHTGAVVGNQWLIHGGVETDSLGKENRPSVESDSFGEIYTFDFRTSRWNQLGAPEESQVLRANEGHTACIVSSEFSHAVYLLFGRSKLNLVTDLMMADFYRPSAHLQVEDDEATLQQLSKMIETKTSKLFGTHCERLFDHLTPLRNSLHEDILPSIDKQLTKIKTKIATSVGELSDEEDSTTAGEGAELFKQIIAALRKSIASISTEANERDLATDFVTSLSAALEVPDKKLMGLIDGEPPSTEVAQLLNNGAKGLQPLNDYLGHVLERLIDPTADPERNPLSEATNILTSFSGPGGEAAEALQKAEVQLRDPGLHPKHRRAIEGSKHEAATQLLDLLYKKIADLVDTLSAPPSGEDRSISRLIEVYENQKAIINEEANNSRVKANKQNKVASYLEKIQREKRRTRLESLGQFEQKRSDFVARRSAVLEEMRSVIVSKLDEYQGLLREERETILEADLLKRENDEVARQLGCLKERVEQERQQKFATHSVLANVVDPMMDALVEVHKESLRTVESGVADEDISLVEGIAVDAAYFLKLLEDVKSQTEKHLESHLSSEKLLNSTIQSRSDYLSLLMSVGDVVHVGDMVESTSPEQLQDSIESLKQSLAAVMKEIEDTAEALQQIETLRINFNEKLNCLNGEAAHPYPPTSRLARMAEHGFDWESAMAKASQTSQKPSWFEQQHQPVPALAMSPLKTSQDTSGDHQEGAKLANKRPAGGAHTHTPSFAAPKGLTNVHKTTTSRPDTTRGTRRGEALSPKPASRGGDGLSVSARARPLSSTRVSSARR